MAKYNRTPIQLPLAIEGETIEIPMTKGYLTIIDVADADLLSLLWKTMLTRSGNIYARSIVKGKHLLLHRVIYERVIGRALLTAERVDHWDTDGLNNRRDNLRMCTGSQNIFNAKLSNANKSGYKGVSRFENRWRAQIGYHGKSVHLGLFDTAEEARDAYQIAAREYAGEFARFE